MPIVLNILVSTTVIADVNVNSLQRYLDAKKELIDLEDNWDELTSGKGAGDSIRRKLGTVYSPPKCISPLCSFDVFAEKFMKDSNGDFDVSEFDGPNSELLDALNQANMWAYSANFAGPEQKIPPAQYIKDSRKQVKRAIKAINEVVQVLQSKN